MVLMFLFFLFRVVYFFCNTRFCISLLVDDEVDYLFLNFDSSSSLSVAATTRSLTFVAYSSMYSVGRAFCDPGDSMMFLIARSLYENERNDSWRIMPLARSSRRLTFFFSLFYLASSASLRCLITNACYFLIACASFSFRWASRSRPLM